MQFFSGTYPQRAHDKKNGPLHLVQQPVIEWYYILVVPKIFPNTFFGCSDFLEKFTGGEDEASFAADYDLFKTVGGCHANPAV